MDSKNVEKEKQAGKSVNRRDFLRMSALAAGASALAGCTQAEPTTSVLATPESQKLVMGYNGIQFWHDQAAEFTAETGIEFVLDGTNYPQLHDKYLASFLAGGGEYDLIHVRDDWVVEFGSRGWLEPLDDRITDEMRANQFEDSFKYLTYDGKIYGLPRYIWLWQFYYNTEIFEEAGIKEPPKTWDELRELAAKTSSPPDHYGFIANFAGATLVNLFTVRLRAEGQELMSGREPTFNSADGVKALQSLVDLVNDGSVDPSSFELETSGQLQDIFIQGRAAMVISTPPTLSMAADPTMSKIVGKVGVDLIPGSKLRSAGFSELAGIAVTSSSKNKDAAFEAAKFVTTPEQQKKMHLAIGRIPTIPALLEDPEVLEIYPAADIVKEQMKYPLGMSVVVPEAPEINVALSNELVSALRGEKEVEKALADAETQVLQILEA